MNPQEPVEIENHMAVTYTEQINQLQSNRKTGGQLVTKACIRQNTCV